MTLDMLYLREKKVNIVLVLIVASAVLSSCFRVHPPQQWRHHYVENNMINTCKIVYSLNPSYGWQVTNQEISILAGEIYTIDFQGGNPPAPSETYVNFIVLSDAGDTLQNLTPMTNDVWEKVPLAINVDETISDYDWILHLK